VTAEPGAGQGEEFTVVFRDGRPVLWQGELVCSLCGHRCAVEVLGRRGHEYPFGDEIGDEEADHAAEADGDEAATKGGPQADGDGGADLEGHIREDYSSEAAGVLAFVPCPKCGKRDPVRLGAEMRRLRRWLATSLVVAAALSGYLFLFHYTRNAWAVVALAVLVVAGRLALVVVTRREAGDRAYFPAREPTPKDSPSGS
jgi:hypothetical protein